MKKILLLVVLAITLIIASTNNSVALYNGYYWIFRCGGCSPPPCQAPCNCAAIVPRCFADEQTCECELIGGYTVAETESYKIIMDNTSGCLLFEEYREGPPIYDTLQFPGYFEYIMGGGDYGFDLVPTIDADNIRLIVRELTLVIDDDTLTSFSFRNVDTLEYSLADLTSNRISNPIYNTCEINLRINQSNLNFKNLDDCDLHLFIISMNGHLIYNKPLESLNSVINLDLPLGTYIVQLIKNQNVVIRNKKVILE